MNSVQKQHLRQTLRHVPFYKSAHQRRTIEIYKLLFFVPRTHLQGLLEDLKDMDIRISKGNFKEIMSIFLYKTGDNCRMNYIFKNIKEAMPWKDKFHVQAPLIFKIYSATNTNAVLAGTRIVLDENFSVSSS